MFVAPPARQAPRPGKTCVKRRSSRQPRVDDSLGTSAGDAPKPWQRFNGMRDIAVRTFFKPPVTACTRPRTWSEPGANGRIAGSAQQHGRPVQPRFGHGGECEGGHRPRSPARISRRRCAASRSTRPGLCAHSYYTIRLLGEDVGMLITGPYHQASSSALSRDRRVSPRQTHQYRRACRASSARRPEGLEPRRL